MNQNIKLKLKSSNFIIFIIFIIILIIIVLVLASLFKLIQINNKSNKSNFENTEPTLSEDSKNASSKAFPDGPPVEDKQKGCNANSDVVGFCMDYDACCGDNLENSKCFCNNPAVKSCKIQHHICMNEPTSKTIYTKQQITDKCNAQNTECCKAYNNISIDTSKFSSPEPRYQKDNILCTLSSVKNIDQKCFELCQTTPDCTSFATTKLSCNLYNSVSNNIPGIDPLTGKKIKTTNSNYYIKK